MRLRLGLFLACTAFTSIATASDPVAADTPAPTDKVSRIYNAISAAFIGPPPVDTVARDKVDHADGILRITDDNYKDIFAAGKPNDVWVIVAHGPLLDQAQVLYKDAHFNASKLMRGINGTEVISDGPVSVQHGDNIFHFTRLDWFTDYQVSTRWLLTKPPYYIFISDNGKTIRSLWAPKTPANGEWLYFLVTKRYWEKLPVWTSSLGPGGKYSGLVEFYIDMNRRWYQATANVPRWAWLIASMFFAGGVQRLVAFLHVRFGGVGSTPSQVNPTRKNVPILATKPNANVPKPKAKAA